MATNQKSIEIQSIFSYNTRSTSQIQGFFKTGSIWFQSQLFIMRIQKQIDYFVIKQMKNYQKWNLQNKTSWKTFREDFKNYNIDDWKKIFVDLIRQFRNYLRKRNIWIKKKFEYFVITTMTKILNEIISTSWTENEIKKCDEIFFFWFVRYQTIIRNWFR